MSNLKYTQEVKDKVLHAYLDEGRTQKSLADEFSIPKATISYWIREYRRECEIKGSNEVFPSDPYEELKRLHQKNMELRKENHFLKKAAAFFAKEQ